MIRHDETLPTHPGALLRSTVIPATGLSKTAIAAGLGISRVSLYDLINERTSVTPEMALRLGKFFGNGPDLWLNMQTSHDLARARRTVDLDAIVTVG